jgi:L-threo-3-deoxy-hexylosonate aldolase
MSTASHPLVPGVYAATLTFFDEHEDIDVPTLQKHIKGLADSGISGIIALGSNGEAAHLSDSERQTVIRTVRSTLDEAGHSNKPVIVGASAHSTRHTIELCKQAKEAGGSHVLVLPPSYYVGAMTDDAIYDFYVKLADASPLPVILYSFPAVSGGINMSSDLLIRVSQHANVIGTKFTCGDTGKLARVARAMGASTPKKTEGYWAVGGLADITLQSLVAGGSGVIAGGANIAPRVCVEVYKLFEQGKLAEAMKMQAVLSQGDAGHTAAGIGTTKCLVEHYFGHGGVARSPLQPVSDEAVKSLADGSSELMEVEKSLSAK